MVKRPSDGRVRAACVWRKTLKSRYNCFYRILPRRTVVCGVLFQHGDLFINRTTLSQTTSFFMASYHLVKNSWITPRISLTTPYLVFTVRIGRLRTDGVRQGSQIFFTAAGDFTYGVDYWASFSTTVPKIVNQFRCLWVVWFRTHQVRSEVLKTVAHLTQNDRGIFVGTSGCQHFLWLVPRKRRSVKAKARPARN